MKTREWERFLVEQKELYDKKLYTIAELANVADTTPNKEGCPPLLSGRCF